jgi:zinc finger protein 830
VYNLCNRYGMSILQSVLTHSQLAIKNAAAWSGHVGSKAHRTNVAQSKAKEAEANQNVAVKRKAPDPDPTAPEVELATGDSANKKQRRPTEFPNDFFSDPSRAIPISNEDEHDEVNSPPPSPPERSTETSAIDLEWEEFQRTVINAPQPIVVEQKAQDEEIRRETWDRATVFAEAELVSEIPEGFPDHLADQSVATVPQTEHKEELPVHELAEKKAQEERELIMDRLMAEEQAQEDADNRVVALKARLEGIRKRKEAVRLKKRNQ